MGSSARGRTYRTSLLHRHPDGLEWFLCLFIINICALPERARTRRHIVPSCWLLLGGISGRFWALDISDSSQYVLICTVMKSPSPGAVKVKACYWRMCSWSLRITTCIYGFTEGTSMSRGHWLVGIEFTMKREGPVLLTTAWTQWPRTLSLPGK